MRELNLETKLGQVAREIQKASSNGQDANIDYLQERLGSSLSRKKIADCASKLYRLGYLERVAFGKYRATKKLNRLAGRAEVEEPSAEHAEAPDKSPAVIIRKQSPEQAEQAAKKRQETDLGRLGNLLDRLEAALDRLEQTTERVTYNFELQETMDLLEQAWAKRKKNYD